MKTTYYVATSVYGYIAKEDGDVSWLEDLGISMEESGYEEFYSTVDAIAMGRKTYEIIVGFGQWPYGDKPTWVCSSADVTPMKGCNLQTGRTPEEVCELARKQNIDHLWVVGGGSLVSAFLEKGLLTNISISLMPIILGNGIKLFGNLSAPVIIKAEHQKISDSGFMQLEYEVKNA